MTIPTILLNPGPVTLTDRVRQALLREDQCHREPEFAELILDIKRRLLAIYSAAGDRYDAVIMTGSGTCAVEAMISSFAPNNGKTLVLTNGVYGERITKMLEVQQKPFIEIRSPWEQAVDLDAARKNLLSDPAITHIATVHNETTTGRLNDIGAIDSLCQEFGKELLLDAVSSFGAEELDFASNNLLAVAATANKCLHAIPAIAFVVARRTTLESATSSSRSLYLDLFRYYREQISGFSPFTQSVQGCFALQEALLELEAAGGWQARRQRYLQLAARVRQELAKLGIKTLLVADDYSSMITSFHLPQGIDYPTLHNHLRRAGFIIYAGQGGLYKSIFRIANMGAIEDSDIDRLLSAFSELIG